MNLEKLKQIFQIKQDLDKNLVRKISFTGVGLAILGIIDGTWLTIAHYTTPVILSCPDTGFINCAKVTTSQYAEIHGVPVALLGLLFFVAMFVLQLPFFWRSQVQWFRYGRLGFSIVGLLMIFWLVYVEFHLLHAICLFCTAAHILTFGLFVTTVIGTSLISPNQTIDQPKPVKVKKSSTR